MADNVGMPSPDNRTATPARSWVSWGAVFSGALIGVAVMTLLELLWLAIAAGGPNFVSNNIPWFMGGTASLATFLAGLFASWFASGRDPVVALPQGLTEWGLLTFVVVVVGPGLAMIFRVGTVVSLSGWLWASFWSVLIGLVATLIGSAIGGMISAPWMTRARVGQPHAPDEDQTLPGAGSESASSDLYRRR